MKKVKKWMSGIILMFSVLLSVLLLYNQISFAADETTDTDQSVYENFLLELNQESDPYQYIYLYDQKDLLYNRMNEEEWKSYLTVLKYFVLEHLATLPEEFRTEGEVDEAITLYVGAKKSLFERNYQEIQAIEDFATISNYAQQHSYVLDGEKKTVIDFETYKEYLKTVLPLDVNRCLNLMNHVDLSKNEEELNCAIEELKSYLKTIAVPNKSLSTEIVDELFRLENIPIQNLLSKSEHTDIASKKTSYGLRTSSDQVFAYGMRGDIATITVTEYYKGGGWKIHDEWSEGYLVTGKEGVVIGNEEPVFCADPQKNFRKGYFNKKPYPFDEDVVKIITASLYKQKQTEEYRWLTKDYQYIAQQCIIWNIENECRQWIKPDHADSRLRLEFGNGVHFPKPHQDVFIAEKVFKLVDECIVWGKQNYKCFLDARADYYVRQDADQPIVRFYGTYTPYGFASLKKSSANPNVTSGNECYSLKGAEYGVYSDQKCTKKVGTLLTDEHGNSNKVSLEAGQYWIKETKAPKGYLLDQQVHSITVISNQTQELKTVDVPFMIPCDILIEKIDKETREKIPQGNASLENAQFEVKFYNGIWKKEVDPGTLGKVPTRTWIFQTNKEGVIRYENGFKVSGDALYTTVDGAPMLPIGTLTIQEKKSPEGYQLNPTIYIIQMINNKEGQETAQICQKTVIPETVLKLDIIKMLKGTNKPIQNVTFTHIRPNGTKETVVTNEKGEASFVGLEHGQHIITESKAPDGYEINPGKINFMVADDNKIVLDESHPTETIENMTFSIKPDGNTLLRVEDQYVDYSLKVHKQNESGKVLEDAKFTLYEDPKCSKIIKKAKTGVEGIAEFTELKVESIYYLKETNAPKGYQISLKDDGSDIIYKIKAVLDPTSETLEYYINDKKQEPDKTSSVIKNPVVHFTVINYKGKKLPETGTGSRLLMYSASMICMVEWLYRKKKYGW